MTNEPLDASVAVTDNVARQRYELQVDGNVAFITYTKDGHQVSFDHTEVPPELGGRGVGSRLARGALELARGQGLKVVPRCSFIAGFVQRHPEFAALMA
jgi:predicted GNAT family acetyltransferase